MAAPTEPRAEDELEIRVAAAERLTFFSDAVLAIAMTLLALDLPVPKGDTNAAFWHSAYSLRGDYLAFVIGFWVIGAHWRGHHRIFRYVSAVTPRLIGWNLLWLLMLVATPFAQRVLIEDGAFAARFTVYAVVQILTCATFQVMLSEIRRNELHRTNAPLRRFTAARFHSLTFAVGFLIAIPIAYFTEWAWLPVALVPMVVGRLGVRYFDLDVNG